MSREVLRDRIAEALWVEFERQRDVDQEGLFVNREAEVVEGPVDMPAVADAVLDLVIRTYGPPF